MYRVLLSWFIAGFAAVPPHAFAEGLDAAPDALLTFESAGESSQTLGDVGMFLSPQAVLALSATATGLLLTATTVYYIETSEAKRRFREGAEQARLGLAKGDAQPITHAGSESSLALAVAIEKATLARDKRPIPEFDERQWAAAVMYHAHQMEAL